MIRLIAGLFGICLLAGACQTPPSSVDAAWGDAYRANRDAQIENPGAGWQEAAKGVDPLTAERILENYEEGQDAQEHRRPGRSGRSVNIIGLTE